MDLEGMRNLTESKMEGLAMLIITIIAIIIIIIIIIISIFNFNSLF
jgi:hypothetical protein